MQDVEEDVLPDFFVSYSGIDRPWAEWIAWQLEEQGYSTIIQLWDFRPGVNFILKMDEATQQAKHTIAVLSPDYLKAHYTHPEWAAALLQDPKGKKGILLPVRVRECDLKGLLASIGYIDLVGLHEVAALKTLLVGLPHRYSEVPSGHTGKFNRSIIEHPLFPGLTSIIQNIPTRRNRYFTGREDILEQLRTRFRMNKASTPRQPIAISGLNGVGKTQIAIEYAHRYLNDYQSILWARATSHETLFSGLLMIAELLNLSEKDLKEQEMAVNAVKHWLQERTEWLLILDNVNNLEVVRDFIPLTEKGDILLTTRNSRVQEVAQNIELVEMQPEEGALFLLRRANIVALNALPDIDSNEHTLARGISEMLGGLPLALDHAGAYIARTECGLSGYIRRYKSLHSELLGYTPQNDNLSVAKTLRLSFKEVRQAHPIAAELLQLCAFLHPDAIPEEIIKGGAVDLGRKLGATAANEIKLDNAIAELRRYSLVRRNADDETLTIHSLVQTILKDATKRNVQQHWAERAVRIVNRAFPDVEPSSWRYCQRYLPHALVCATLITEWRMTFIDAARLLHRTGQYLLERAQYSQAKPLLIQARVIYENKLEPEDTELATILDDLGRLYAEQGGDTAYTDAELLYLQALAIRERTPDSEDPKVAQSLNHLALLYYNQGKYTQAEPLYVRAKAIQEQVLGFHSSDLAITLSNLAWLYYNLGQYNKVEPLLARALELQEKLEGSEPPAMAATLNALAMFYRAKGRYTEAESLFQRALAIRERELGQNHPDVATTLNDLAWLYRTIGRYIEARKLYWRALTIREQSLGPGHLHVATTLCDMAALYSDEGQYAKAENLYQRALTTRESVLGPEHPRVGTILYYMGWLYYHQGKYAQAESFHKRALEIRKKVLGPENLLHVARSLNALAEVYHEQGRYPQAEQVCLQALEIRQQALNPTHRNVVTSLSNLASIYVDMGKYTQAESLHKRALELRTQTQGPELPRMIIVLSNAASLYVEQGKYAQAESLYKQALTLYEEAYANLLDSEHPEEHSEAVIEHPDVANVLSNLASLYVIQGRYPLAESHYERALSARKEVFGVDHPLLGQSYDGLATVYRLQKKYKEAEFLYRRALAIREKALGAEHPHVAQTHNNLALLYIAQEKYTSAASLLQLALAIREKILGPEHPHVAQSLNSLAEIYCVLGNYNQAKSLYKRALAIDELALGLEHPHLATILLNYASLQHKMKREANARKLEDRARAIQAKLVQENTIVN